MAKWGNALGGWRKQKRNRKGQFGGSGGSKARYKASVRSSKKTMRREIKSSQNRHLRKKNHNGRSYATHTRNAMIVSAVASPMAGIAYQAVTNVRYQNEIQKHEESVRKSRAAHKKRKKAAKSAYKRGDSPKKRSTSTKKRSTSTKKRSTSTKKRSTSTKKRSTSGSKNRNSSTKKSSSNKKKR